MNLAGTFSVYIGIFLIICVKCEFSFTLMLTSGFNKIGSIIENIQCNFVECCTNEYIFSDIDSMYI